MSNERPSDRLWLAYGALAIGVMCIGCSAIFVKIAGAPGPVSAFYRVLVACVVLVPWRFKRRSLRPSKSDVILIMAGGVFFAFDLALWNTGLLLTSAATATLLANTAPLWVGLGSLFLFHEYLSTHYWSGLAIAIAGMSFIVGIDALRRLSLNTGDGLAIGASVFYAAYLLTTQRARARVDTLTLMTLSVSSSMVILLLMNLILKMPLKGYSIKTWASLAGLGLVSQLGGWLAINYSLGYLRAASVSVCLLGQPVVTALLSIPILGEYLNLNQIFGGALVLGGIYLVNRQITKRKQMA
ncbi:MAG: DMT family transporter [Thermodesulfobacteriota bacterium]